MTVEEFNKMFDSTYQYMYDHDDRVPAGSAISMREAAKLFDGWLSDGSYRECLTAFCQYRSDIVSSDREAAAFVLTVQRCETLGYELPRAKGAEISEKADAVVAARNIDDKKYWIEVTFGHNLWDRTEPDEWILHHGDGRPNDEIILRGNCCEPDTDDNPDEVTARKWREIDAEIDSRGIEEKIEAGLGFLPDYVVKKKFGVSGYDGENLGDYDPIFAENELEAMSVAVAWVSETYRELGEDCEDDDDGADVAVCNYYTGKVEDHQWVDNPCHKTREPAQKKHKSRGR